jgi:predicted phage-related endonuclease
MKETLMLETMVEHLPGMLTVHDLDERKNYIAASDVSAVMGTSPFRNGSDVYFEKMTDLEPLVPNDAMIWGHLLEIILVKWARHVIGKRLGFPITTTRQGCRRRHKNGIMSCTLDARILDMDAALECKTHALTYRKPNLEEWGPSWSSEIPPHHLDQVCAQLACCPDINTLYVVLCVGFTSPRIYEIKRQDHLARIAQIETYVCDWWEAHIIPGIPPAETPGIETVKRMNITKVVGVVQEDIPDQLLERRKKLGTLLGKVTKEKEKLDAQITLTMGNALQGRSPKGHRVVVQTCRNGGYTVKEFTYQKTNIYLAKS